MKPGRIERFKRCVAQAEQYPYRIERFNCEMHWRVTVDGIAYDFWPATGKYRKHGQTGAVTDVAADFNDFLERAAASAQEQVIA